MNSQVVSLLVLAGLLLAGFLLWPLLGPRLRASEQKRRGRSAGGGMLGVVDEVFRPQTHQAQLVWEAQQEMPAPAPLPGDGDLGAGRIRLTLPDAPGSPAAR
ncbi:hypothetical protein [Microterricola viridarii]|uniref:Uncharacterized protein n=1 Tax=Microterricola viridarii TaxID=412690 RepID=A0A0X8E134_9MICO|nr:hypothetical protein [Microterricola viridarii]AMB58389.1 hypothetical protein AWU67_05460 [Microterricola viridarii]